MTHALWNHPAASEAAAEAPDFVELPTMPFSPRNRMKTFLVLAMLIDSVIIIGGVVWLQKYNTTASSTPLSYAIIAFGGLGLKELLVMLHTHQENRQTRHDLKGAMNVTTGIIQNVALEMDRKTNGGLTKAVEKMGEQVRKAERDQLISDPECLKAMEKVSERAADQAAEKAVRRMMDELRGGGARG